MAGTETTGDGATERRAEIGRDKRARTRAMLLRAAFDVLGREDGRIAQVDEVIARAGIARGTFYNYFPTIHELYNGLSHHLTHEFNAAVYREMALIETAAEKVSLGVRSYLWHTTQDRHWGWGMVNMSARGPTFGAETFDHARIVTQKGLDSGDFTCGSAAAGRDIQLGALLAGMIALLQGAGQAHADFVAMGILRGLGVPRQRAEALIALPLPSFERL